MTTGTSDGYEGPTVGRYYQGPGQVVEFWVLDVEGTPLVIEATWFPDSPAKTPPSSERSSTRSSLAREQKHGPVQISGDSTAAQSFPFQVAAALVGLCSNQDR